MRFLAGAVFIFFAASTGISFAQHSKATDIPLATWELGTRINIDNRIDPIVTGQSLSVDDLNKWKTRKQQFLNCGLCGQEQDFPSE